MCCVFIYTSNVSNALSLIRRLGSGFYFYRDCSIWGSFNFPRPKKLFGIISIPYLLLTAATSALAILHHVLAAVTVVSLTRAVAI